MAKTTLIAHDETNIIPPEEQDRLQGAQQASRMLSEEELFYVDLSSDVNLDDSSRHDHGHLRGASLEAVAHVGAADQMLTPHSEHLGCDPTVVSRSSSSRSMDEYPQKLLFPGTAAPGAADSLAESHELFSHQSRLLVPASPRAPEFCEEYVANPCASLLGGLQMAWGRLTGQPGFVNGNRVVCMCRHLNSCTSSKTFRNVDSDLDDPHRLGVVPETYILQIARFRVVSTVWGRHAEYEVYVTGGGRRWIRWKRFSNFKSLAATWTKADRSNCTKAWRRVTTIQPPYRCLDRNYLATKCRLLEEFMQQVVFEIPTPAPLIEFMTHNAK